MGILSRIGREGCFPLRLELEQGDYRTCTTSSIVLLAYLFLVSFPEKHYLINSNYPEDPADSRGHVDKNIQRPVYTIECIYLWMSIQWLLCPSPGTRSPPKVCAWPVIIR